MWEIVYLDWFGANQGKLYNCYTIGTIKNKYLVENNIYPNSYISNCFYLQGTCNNISRNTNSESIDSFSSTKSQDVLMSQDFLQTLNECIEIKYSNYWKSDTNVINQGYPILNWQK